jgi:hypothetical protein
MNSRKPGTKFDKKMYEFEKKKQMIEELRNKERNNQKEREKTLRDKEINSLFNRDNLTKINTDLKKSQVEDPGSSRYGKTHDKYTLAISLDKKDKTKLPIEKEEEKVNDTSESINQSLPNNESDLFNQSIKSNPTIITTNNESKTDFIIEAEKIEKIEKPTEKQLENPKVINEVKIEKEITQSSQPTSIIADENKYEKSIEKPKSPIIIEEFPTARKFSFQQQSNNKIEKTELVEKPLENKLSDAVNDINNLTKLSAASTNNITDKKSSDKTSTDLIKDQSLAICNSTSSPTKESKKPDETVAEIVDDSLLSKKSSYKLINISTEKNETEKFEKLENKTTEIFPDVSTTQITSSQHNNATMDKKNTEKVEKTENLVHGQLNSEPSITVKTPIKQTLSSTIDKKTTEAKKDPKREIRRESRKEMKKEEKKEEKKEVKRDISKKLPDKKIEKKEEKKESKEDKKEIKEEKIEVKLPKEEKEKILENNQNNKQEIIVNNYIDKTNAEVTSEEKNITQKETQNAHKKSLSEFNFPKAEDFQCDRSKIEENAENNNYESERDIYNVFLYESVPHQKEPLQLLLRDQMKNIIYNMKDRKKEIETVKVDKKKQILENLSRINDSTISKEISHYPKLNREIIIESCNNNSFFNQSEVKKEFQTRDLTNIEDSFLNRNQFKKSIDKDNNNLAKLIKEFENEFRKNDFEKDKIRVNPDDIISPSEVSSIHLSNNTDNEKNKKKKSITIDFEDYLKENRDEGETIRLETNQNLDYHDETENGQKIYNNIVNKIQNLTDASKVERTHLTMADDSIMFSKNRSELLVFGDYENPQD